MSDDSKTYNVLFLCTHNSNRSIIAESILNDVGRGKFKGFSAGSQPRGYVNPFALDLLKKLNYDISDARSKTWDEFANADAPPLDFVFTVCDDAAGEVCPVWPGQPVSAHWGVEDPSRVEGTHAEVHAAFAETHRMLYQRISIFVNLPFHQLDQLTLQKRLEDIGGKQTAVSEQT